MSDKYQGGETQMERDDLRRAALDAMRAARTRQSRAAADEFMLAATYADLYHELDGESGAVLHGERMVSPGDGCPEVAEFAPLEMAARLGIRPEAAAGTIWSALTVRHRLPEIWTAVDQLRVPVWSAQQLASATLDLDLDQCLEVSRQLAALIGTMSPQRLLQTAKAAVLERQAGKATDQRDQQLASRRVSVWQDDHTASVEARVSKADGIWLDTQLSRIAGILGEAGDTDSLDVRRAKALGVLASPARALQLLQASLTDELPDELDVECPAAGQRGHSCGQISVAPDQLLPHATLVVHLTDETLKSGEGLVRSTQLGPQLAQWLGDLLHDTRVTVRPVLDVASLKPSSAYEVPPTMREAIVLRHETSVFPFSTRSSRGLDLDHTEPFDVSGPPGQTRPDNLGPLARKEHRAKTHAGYDCEQPSPGVFIWTTPLGYRYLVTPSATIPLDQASVPGLEAFLTEPEEEELDHDGGDTDQLEPDTDPREPDDYVDHPGDVWRVSFNGVDLLAA